MSVSSFRAWTFRNPCCAELISWRPVMYGVRISCRWGMIWLCWMRESILPMGNIRRMHSAFFSRFDDRACLHCERTSCANGDMISVHCEEKQTFKDRLRTMIDRSGKDVWGDQN